MCIVFIYKGHDIKESDYSLILAANRDEFYNRPSKNATTWNEDKDVIGGRDMEAGCEGGTWFAISPLRKKLGLLLNLPGSTKAHAKSRGKIVENFMKKYETVECYVDSLKEYSKETNDFIFVTVDYRNSYPTVQTYNNVTDQLVTWSDIAHGFSNSLPDIPLKKAEAGKNRMEEICSRLNKSNKRDILIAELIDLLRWDKSHLPDQELERRNPSKYYEKLSSVFVCIPEHKYGTRTHSIVLVTKTGHAEFIEITMQPPINPLQPDWKETEFQFEF